MTTTYKRLAASTALALALSGLGAGSAVAAPAPVASQRAQSAATAEHRHMSHDLHFVTMMIPHHQDAIAMAELALERSDRAKVRKLSQQIIDAQSAEIDELRAAVDRLSAQQPKRGHRHGHRHHGRGHHDGHGHHHARGMHSGMSDDMMDRMGDMDLEELAKLSGAEFDRAFLGQMIAHHQMAVEMAKMELKMGTDREVRAMAKETIKDQGAEIELMRSWLRDWFRA